MEKEVLRINWILPRPNLSGGIKSNRLLAEAMARRGHRVTLVYANTAAPWPSVLRPRRFARRVLQELGRRVRQRHHLERSTAHLLPVAGSRIEASQVPDGDVTIATWWETAEWIREWPESKGLKAYLIRHYEVHGGDPDRVRSTYRLPYLKIVTARWLQQLMAEKFGDGCATLVPNGVDWSQFTCRPRSKNVRPAVGMLYGRQPWKGSWTGFEAVLIAQRRWPSLRVVAFGASRLPRSSRLPANVEFHLRPAQDTIPALYQKCDCWLVPSVTEGFGMPGLEAAACWCPLVATRSGGPEDYVVPGRNGYLVDVGDTVAMAQRILSIVGSDEGPWQRMSRASHEIARGFDWDRSAETLEGALASALRRARCGTGWMR